MKKLIVAIIMLAAVMLSGCISPSFTGITENSFIITLNLRNPSLTFINEDGKRFADWELEEMYTGGTLLPQGDRLLLYGTQMEYADIYSLKKGKRINRWKVPEGTTGAQYIQETKEVVFANKQDGSLHFYNEAGEETGIVRTGIYPISVAASEGMLYAVDYKGETVSEVSINGKKVVREFPVASSSTGVMVLPEEKELWIGGHGQGAVPQASIHIYSLETGKEKEQLSAPVMPVNFLKLNGFYYAVSHGSNKVHMFNSYRQKVNETEVGANPFAIASFQSQVIAAGYDSDALYFLDPDTLKLIKKVKTGKGPFMMFVKE